MLKRVTILAHPPVLQPNLPDCPSLSRQLTVCTSSTSIVQVDSQRNMHLKVKGMPRGGGAREGCKNINLISFPFHEPLKFVVWERDYGTNMLTVCSASKWLLLLLCVISTSSCPIEIFQLPE